MHRHLKFVMYSYDDVFDFNQYTAHGSSQEGAERAYNECVNTEGYRPTALLRSLSVLATDAAASRAVAQRAVGSKGQTD